MNRSVWSLPLLLSMAGINPAGLSAAPAESIVAVALAAGTQAGMRQTEPELAPESTSEPITAAVAFLVARGRSQFLAGDPVAAAETFRRVEALEPKNPAATDFLKRIASGQAVAAADRVRTSNEMIHEVNKAWQRAGPGQEMTAEPASSTSRSLLWEKLGNIVLPSVNFSGLELGRVVNTLSAISEEFDDTGTNPKGVNIVLLAQGGPGPAVSITLRNLSLKRVLDLITGSVGYQYEVQADTVVVRPGDTQSGLDTRFFAISRATVLRMTSRGPSRNKASGVDLLAGGGTTFPVASIEGESRAIRDFLQLAGVDFETAPGGTLAFDGSQLIVTQTPRNLERIRNILVRYQNVRQVEIEAKFMEVQQGALEELGVQWNVATSSTRVGGTQATYSTGGGVNRSLAEAFKNATTTQQISITGTGQPEGGLNLPATAPSIPGGVMLGSTAGPLASIAGVAGEFDVNAIVRALSQKNGTELLSAPKLTVLSGNQATITVAQEMRYPQSYGQIQSQVGTGSNSGGGSAGVSITSGTPQEFTTRNVGVELKVTPTVEEDDRSISLDLNPKVTEFEGFVEYGGPSIAISGGTTVTVPPGFYQPIFAVREMTTKVTIWDGATLVMGGLTREEVKKVHDKVPVLGSLPLIGRLFRSEGESTQKRNLLIFVTANLVTPGGALTKHHGPGSTAEPSHEDLNIVNSDEPASRSK